MREALNNRQDLDASALLEATQGVRRVACDLIQSPRYGGPLTPEARKFWHAAIMLMGADRWIANRVVEARRSGSGEVAELRAARRTTELLLSELFDSLRRGSEYMEDET
jgi:hypothetical protein